ncbi:hypothetical protein [Novosphingobium capsulatum]|uniref:hypothetical protein n=1 Tax=Novosphingobium capsulatum TaxID=13688 RepID=UPI0012ED3008|nr:hypothetical protein [Novosphingobium capsulatum]WQD92572.1 hypothetical protein U0041_16515 [Novosphingobium capsulatum]
MIGAAQQKGTTYDAATPRVEPDCSLLCADASELRHVPCDKPITADRIQTGRYGIRLATITGTYHQAASIAVGSNQMLYVGVRRQQRRYRNACRQVFPLFRRTRAATFGGYDSSVSHPLIGFNAPLTLRRRIAFRIQIEKSFASECRGLCDLVEMTDTIRQVKRYTSSGPTAFGPIIFVTHYDKLSVVGGTPTVAKAGGVASAPGGRLWK